MKKITKLILFCSLTILLSGCSSQSSQPTTYTEIKGDGSKEVCVTNCLMLWKVDQANARKSEDGLIERCDAACEKK